MISAKAFSVLLLFVTVAVVSSPTQQTQENEPVPAPFHVGPLPPESMPAVEIHVNRSCLIMPNPADRVPALDLQLRHDEAVCHLESQLSSQHREEMVVGAQLLISNVQIREQEYVLQNVTQQPAVFVVEHRVPEKWRIDSDPEPASYEGPIALFRVHADPGQIVRLHVGMRHVSHQSARRIRG